MKPKLIRITTIPLSLEKLLGGQLSYMKEYYNVIAVSSDESHLKKVAEKEGIGMYYVEMTRRITPFKDIGALWRLYRFFRKEKPFIVHTHTPKAGTVGMVAAWLARVPYRLHTVAGLPLLEVRGNKRRLLNIVERVTYRCATHVYPNSLGLREIIIKEKLCTKQNKLKVIANGSSNGINTSYYTPSLFTAESKQNLRNDLGIEENDFVFIFVGRLVTDKGVNELVKAFGEVCKRYTSVKLLLVGAMESELDPLKKETIEEVERNENIISVGWQSDVRPYFAISDTLVLPSYREGFPNVVMQAGAMGLPSIVTNINGCNEIIVEGENGTIIPVKSCEVLKSKMEEFITNKDLLSSFKPRVREMISSRYEQKVVWEALLEEYRSLENKRKNV